MVSESGIEDLMMGKVSEDLKESQEVYDERVRQAQVKMVQIRKDEKHDKSFDSVLTGIIKDNKSEAVLNAIVFMLDYGLPSLTILSAISVVNDEAMNACWGDLSEKINKDTKIIEGFEDIKNKEHKKRLIYWLKFIKIADKASKTTKVESLNNDFHDGFTQLLSGLCTLFLEIYKIDKDSQFSSERIKKIIDSYK